MCAYFDGESRRNCAFQKSCELGCVLVAVDFTWEGDFLYYLPVSNIFGIPTYQRFTLVNRNLQFFFLDCDSFATNISQYSKLGIYDNMPS